MTQDIHKKITNQEEKEQEDETDDHQLPVLRPSFLFADVDTDRLC